MNFATLKKVCLLIVCYILIVGFQQTNAQLSGKKIGIDPGHGGSDPGAVGWDGPGYPDEKDFNLAVGLKYRTKLQNAGAIVEMTRTSDIYVSLVARVEKLNNFQPHHYVSIHCNSHSDPSANGTETYWHTLGYPTDQLLATKIQSRLVQFLGRRDRGVKQADLIVLTANSPAALAELLFISNQIEFNIINSESGQENAATGLYYGSFDFVNSSSPTLSVNPTSLSFGDVPVGTSSIPKSYTITGSNLTSNVVINAPSGFEISTSSGGPYGSSLTLSPSSGSISATVYVRFSPTSAQSYSGNITNTSSGITRNVSVSGTGVQVVSARIDNYSPSTKITVSPGQVFDLKVWFTNTGSSAGYFYPGVTIWNSSYQIVFDSYGNKTYLASGSQGSYTWSTSLNTPGDYWLQFGIWDETKTNLLDKKPSPRQNLIQVVSPTLSVNPTSLSFGDVPVGTSSIPKSYTITGSNLTSNVVINAPSGFEISTSSGGPYGSSLTLSPSSGSISATVYVRFSPTSAQSYSGNITNTSSGITRNVSVSGTGVQPTPSPPVLVSPGTSSPPGQIFYNMPPSLFIWRSVPNVDMYGFYQEKRDTSGKWVLISQKNTPDTSLSFVYVQVVGAYDGEYRWYVNAHNSAGWGSFSAPLYYKVVTPASISVDLAYIDFGDVQVGSFLDKNITIRNSGSGTLSVRLSISGNSFSIISGGDTFNLSSGQTRVVGIRFSPASGGSYTGTLNITHNATNQPSPITIPLSGNGVELVTHGIPLLKGWNMISSFVLPIDIKLDSIFKNIKSNLVILKDGLGRSYWPFLGVDQIGNWSIYSGYQVYMKNPDTLKIVGHIIKPETTIYSLQKGWNLISYVRRTPMDIDSALSSIKSYINIVKDNDGRVYWPKYTVNQIGLMRPGQGYLINVTQECRFSYPANEQVSTSINLNIIGSTDSSYKTSSEPVHFKFVRNTGNNATVGIPLSAQPSVNGVPLEIGDEIGAFTPAGLCVGAVVWEQKNTALTVWGDDEMTQEVDGIKPGEQISYRIWKRSTDREYQATATYSLGDGIYQPNAIFILSSLSARLTPVEISDVNLPNTFVLYQNYPNPFNPTTTIKYGIPVRAHVKLEIYNILGQKVETLIDALQEPGFYFFDIDASRFSGGVYFYRLTAVSEKSVFSDYKKMIILK
jgi:N-acetylmuramoyl-L-alanine amidase